MSVVKGAVLDVQHRAMVDVMAHVKAAQELVKTHAHVDVQHTAMVSVVILKRIKEGMLTNCEIRISNIM